ncbi:MAG: UDP-glucose 4-epimerase GalE [Deltaproteobacteria bacterium]|jgi:UDP-glucose 4-epimerase|nr:UDP-glucose 4-epimerase GalE [Deltaproteobacteria bacterium]MBT4087603.1 UDP-glucose 4-epimerase GalE [Deltaproteobacteria bacterium]MBT4266971.1 UDP-glucose 4-epimerase GalE [Deltaproteobacteria bacterium]MBT4639692.1 UDP-glucose 4-epimerase GalE [Deltaproteobacteria bacterium]MBT6504157.1 UDP-glucose 4-epimerase GalE [Deltaproteobacteria bacterium]
MSDSILVIGGAGYIGSHVVQTFLKANYRVTVFDNLSSGQEINLFKQARFIPGDIQNREQLKELFTEKFDAVIHLAALKAAGESMEIPEQYAYQNINGTMNLLEAVSLSQTRIVVFSSSAAVYGMPNYLPLDENHPVDPINFYGFTKYEVERFLGWYDRLKGIKFASLRYFNAAGYDPGGEILGLEIAPANLIPVVMETAAGIRAEMSVFGDDYPTPDGTGIRDYIHVSDLARAHLLAYQKIQNTAQSLILNLGTGKGHSVLEIISMAERITGRKLNYTVTKRREGDPAELYTGLKVARETLGWEPEFSDLESLVKTTWQVYQHPFNRK